MNNNYANMHFQTCEICLSEGANDDLPSPSYSFPKFRNHSNNRD